MIPCFKAMRLAVISCLFCLGAMNAADDWRQTLHLIRQTVAEAVGRSDNYICVQDLARYYYLVPNTDAACRQPPTVPSTPLRLEDRLKLDVAVSQGAEIYSWHGEQKFSADTIGQVVRKGPIASGSFNGYLRNIFGEPGVTFTFLGRKEVDKLDLFEFDFDVPLSSSHYQVQVGKGMALVAFHGSFTARFDNYQLYSLTVVADGNQIPKKSNICGAGTTLTYQLVKISNHESLLPASFDLLMGGRDLLFTESKGRYTECHEYSGQSTVHFDSTDPAAEKFTPTLADAEPIRPDIELSVELVTPIDEDLAYTGQPIDAVLLRNVKIAKNKTLHSGATLHGTITGFQIQLTPEHSVSLNIQLTSIADGQQLYLCTAVHYTPVILRSLRGRIPGTANRQDFDDGTMVFTDTHVHLDKQFKTSFITVDHLTANQAESASR